MTYQCKIFMYRQPNFYQDYQNYYIDGIKQLGIPFKSNSSDLDVFPISFGQYHNQHVGQYIISFANGKQIKCAIDAGDGPEVRSNEICDWSDIYFKSNFWPAIKYAQKVVPVVNGNGITRILKLKELRQRNKIFDFAFVSAVHGGREHNIRLFEKLSKVNGNNKLLAIFNEYDAKYPETTDYKRRLIVAGVPFADRGVKKEELWSLMSQSRYVVIRAGKHLCIPWRMIDLLCLGSSIIFDAIPYPQWPQPLINKVHYISLDVARFPNGDIARQEDYENIPDKITEILADADMQKKLSQNSEIYFDKYASPEKVVQYLLDWASIVSDTEKK